MVYNKNNGTKFRVSESDNLTSIFEVNMKDKLINLKNILIDPKDRLLKIYCTLLILIFLFPPVTWSGRNRGWEFIFTMFETYDINFPLMLIEILIVTLIFGAIYYTKNKKN